MFATSNYKYLVIALAVSGFGLAQACSSSSKSAGSNGGESGGSANGGDTGGDSGGGGRANNSGGSGGKSGGASGGSAGAKGGAGGGGQSGGNGSGGTGGVSSSMCTPLSAIAGKADADIAPNLTFCEPACVYRPNWPGHHVCGPEGSVFKPVALKTDGFCGAQYNQDGVFPVPGAQLDPPAYAQARNDANLVANPVPGVFRAYLPGGTAAYSAAPAGKVALTFWTGIMSGNDEYARSVFKVENIHEYLVQKKEMPYTIAIFINDDLAGNDRIKQLKNTIIPALKKKWDKISDDPNYRAIVGQSTAGANAFDTVWMGTDIVAKGIGGSPSFACFTCMNNWGGCAKNCDQKNLGYMNEVAFCPARPIRWTGTVGTCDISGTLDQRTELGCPGIDPGGSIDSSGCNADWLTQNKLMTTALKDKGLPSQLFIVKDGIHNHQTWGGVALPYQLRWLFKDITCAM